MKVLVAIKRVVDPNIKIHIKHDGTLDTTHLKKVINPFDEIALEEAIRLKEKGNVREVIAVSLGSLHVQETLRHALALGADKAILVQTENELSPLMTANILAALAKQEMPHLFFLGKQAVDSDNNQVGQMLAGLLNWSQGTFISKLELESEKALITREIDSGLETLSLSLPAVITTDLRLNTPRYASLPNIVKAKQKPLSLLTPEQLNVTLSESTCKILKMELPPSKKGGVRVSTAKELIQKLKAEAKVL